MKLRIDIKDYSAAIQWIEKHYPGEMSESEQITLMTRYYALNLFVENMTGQQRQRLLSYIRVKRKRRLDKEGLVCDHVIHVSKKTHDRLMAYHQSLIDTFGDDANLDVALNDMIDRVTY